MAEHKKRCILLQSNIELQFIYTFMQTCIPVMICINRPLVCYNKYHLLDCRHIRTCMYSVVVMINKQKRDAVRKCRTLNVKVILCLLLLPTTSNIKTNCRIHLIYYNKIVVNSQKRKLCFKSECKLV